MNDPLINAGSIFVRSITGGMVAQPFTLDICYEKTATKFVSPSKSSNFKRWMPPVAQIHWDSWHFDGVFFSCQGFWNAARSSPTSSSPMMD